MKFHLTSMTMVVGVSMLLSATSAQEEYPRVYYEWNSEEIQGAVTGWAEEYPDLIHVSTSQETFGLPSAGNPEDCPFDGEDIGCLNYYGIIQDYIAHPEDSDSSNRLPAMLLSGALHGDERVGPSAIMETVALLLKATTCEALPSIPEEIEEALECRQKMKDEGITDVQRQWLARLVTTRRIVVVPTPNALGFFRGIREEDTIDPNRDFPFDLPASDLCMQTIAARTLNELFREDIFQFCFSFHGGIEMIGYEWGADSYIDTPISPDHEAQSQLASAFSLYGSGWNEHPQYITGTMNEIIYSAGGGMEDWAYAGSWDSDHTLQCAPTTYGGYPSGKTIYEDATLRAFNMLVETSTLKTPLENNMGTSEDVLSKDSNGNGHVSRNIRLCISAIDMVEPYLSIVGVNELTVFDDVVPLKAPSCDDVPIVSVAPGADEVTISWSVGGAMEIDTTRLWVMNSDEVEGDCNYKPPMDDPYAPFKEAQRGAGYFSLDASHVVGSSPLNPMFSTIVNISQLSDDGELMVIASARVDKAWLNQPFDVLPRVPPQAHLANVRTNPDWYHESANKIVEGRLDWFSVPIKIVRGAVDETTQINDRFKMEETPPTADATTEENPTLTLVSSVTGPALTQGQTTPLVSGAPDRTGSLLIDLVVGALSLLFVAF